MRIIYKLIFKPIIHTLLCLRAIIKKLTEDFCEWIVDDKRREIMKNTSRNGWFIFIIDTLVLSMTTMFFFTRALIGHTFPTPASGLTIPYVDNQQSPYYEILCGLQVCDVYVCYVTTEREIDTDFIYLMRAEIYGRRYSYLQV